MIGADSWLSPAPSAVAHRQIVDIRGMTSSARQGVAVVAEPSQSMRVLCVLAKPKGGGYRCLATAFVRSAAFCVRCSEMTEGGRLSVKPIFHLM